MKEKSNKKSQVTRAGVIAWAWDPARWSPPFIGGGDDSFNTFFAETGAGKHVPEQFSWISNWPWSTNRTGPIGNSSTRSNS